MLRAVAASGVLAICVGACGGESQDGNQAQALGADVAPAATESAAPAAVAAAAAPQAVASRAREGECHANQVSVSAKHSAHEEYAALPWNDLKSVFGRRIVAGLGADGTAILVFMSTKTLDPEQIPSRNYKELLGQDGFVQIGFSNGTGAHPEGGDYAMDDNNRAPHRVTFAVQVGGTSQTTTKSNWGKPDAVGTASLTHLTDDRICGTFSLEDPWRVITGSFDAPLSDTGAARLAMAGN